MATRKNDRIFNRDGLRHYRRTYSLTEVRIGLVIVALLIGIAWWISWKGDHQDPELFSLDPALLDKGDKDGKQPVEGARKAPGQQSGKQPAAKPSERGPVPTGLAAPGWTENSLSSFDPDNLYVKINGREGYYKSFGFKMLYFVALAKDDDETATVDIEMYDLGTIANALGAYAGERQPDARSELGEAGIGHISRNAMFLVRGRFYVRAVGSDENDVIMAQLSHLEKALDNGLPREELPWGYAVFAGQMGMNPGKIGFVPENAFSFGFANNVFTVQLSDDGAELFATAAESADAAAELASKFTEGFKSYGEVDTEADGVAWVKDRYLGNVSGAKAVRSLVIGVYSGADVASAQSELKRLDATARSLSESVLERAAAAGAQAKKEPAGDAYGAAEGESGDQGDGDGGGESDGAPEEGYGEPGESGEPAEGAETYDQEPGASAGPSDGADDESQSAEPVEEM